MKQKRIGLKALAEHLGVSQATVSRALAGHAAISSATRERVANAARDLGYRPNSAARGLATGRTNAVGLVFPLERLLLGQTNFFDVLAGLTEALARCNYDLVMSPFLGDDEATVLRRLASSSAVDGVIITRARVHDERIPLLNALGLPFVVHGRTDLVASYSFVDIDNEAVFEKAANLLLDLGHVRIAALNAPLALRYASARRTGLLRAYERHGLQHDPALHFETPMTEQVGYEIAMQTLKGAAPPTAFICGSVFSALGVYRGLKDLGLDPGHDVSVVAHDDMHDWDRRAIHFEPTLTATESSVRKAGERLGEILLELVARSEEHREPICEVWPVELVVRDSISRPKVSAGSRRSHR